MCAFTYSCTTTEKLTICNTQDLKVTGYSKNMKYYQVVNGCGGFHPNIKIEGDTLKVDDILIREEFRYTFSNP